MRKKKKQQRWRAFTASSWMNSLNYRRRASVSFSNKTHFSPTRTKTGTESCYRAAKPSSSSPRPLYLVQRWQNFCSQIAKFLAVSKKPFIVASERARESEMENLVAVWLFDARNSQLITWAAVLWGALIQLALSFIIAVSVLWWFKTRAAAGWPDKRQEKVVCQ